MDDIRFETTRIDLNDGSLYIFTDGVTESVAPDGCELGVDGLCKIIDALAGLDSGQRLEAIVTEIGNQKRKVHDDLTLLLIEKKTNVYTDDA